MQAPQPMSEELAAAVQRHLGHYQETMGRIPESFATMSRVAPEAFDGYSRMREWVLRPESELPLKYKHLLWLALDAAQDNEHGTLLHTKVAIEHGLTLGELTEAMVLMLMLTGVSSWGKHGRKVIEYAERLLQERDQATDLDSER